MYHQDGVLRKLNVELLIASDMHTWTVVNHMQFGMLCKPNIVILNNAVQRSRFANLIN